jgi:hypothetical protein
MAYGPETGSRTVNKLIEAIMPSAGSVATALNSGKVWRVGSVTVLVEPEQTAEYPGLPMQVLFGNPSTCPLRIICTASIPAMTAQAVTRVRGPCMLRRRRFYVAMVGFRCDCSSSVGFDADNCDGVHLRSVVLEWPRDNFVQRRAPFLLAAGDQEAQASSDPS